MKHISEYDERQLRLMHENLISFEMKQIELGSLVGSLEFLLNSLESKDDEWEEKILDEITILETVNALTVIKDSGEEVMDIQKDKKDRFVYNSIKNLKNLIEIKVHIH